MALEPVHRHLLKGLPPGVGLDGHNPLVARQQLLDVVQDGAAVGVAADQVGLHQPGRRLGEGLGIAAGEDGDGAGVVPLGLPQPFAALLVPEVGDGAAVDDVDVGGLALGHHREAVALKQLLQGAGLVEVHLAAKGIKNILAWDILSCIAAPPAPKNQEQRGKTGQIVLLSISNPTEKRKMAPGRTGRGRRCIESHWSGPAARRDPRITPQPAAQRDGGKEAMVRRSLALSCAAALCLWLVVLAFGPAARGAEGMQPEAQPAAAPAAVEAAAGDILSLPCRTAILIDQDTGTVLYEKNADQRVPIASITKVMTLLLTFEAIHAGKIDYDTKVPVSNHAASMGGSQIWLEPGEDFTLDQMLRAICVSSANDAAVAVAELVGGGAARNPLWP